MTRLTHEELTEPHVTLRIPIEKWNELPRDVCDLLRLFIVRDDITSLVVELPGYRWREWKGRWRLEG